MRFVELLKSKSKLIFRISLVVVVLSVLFRVGVSCTVAVKGCELVTLSEYKMSLEQEIARLEFEDMRLSSLVFLEQRASELGFVQMSDSLLVLKPSSIAATYFVE